MLIPTRLWLALGLLGFALSLTVVPGVFNIDESHYLVSVAGLQHGQLTVPGTEELSPSREVASFDPVAKWRRIDSTPVSPTIPPLYAFFALPFSYLGWRGLVALNTLALLVATALVFGHTQRYTPTPSTPWLAASAFALGSSVLEYAQGVWPHLLAIAFCLTAVVLASRAREEGLGWAALGAGLAIGLATGVRYQNIFFGGCLGLGLLFWARRRLAMCGFYILGLAGPLLANSVLNHLRLGFWNPISKGGRSYLRLGLIDRATRAGGTATSPSAGAEPGLLESFGNGIERGVELVLNITTVWWAKVVDFTTHPRLPFLEEVLNYVPDPDSGAFMLLGRGAIKKAWLQSSPWMLLALVILLWVWIRWKPNGVSPELAKRQRGEMRALSLIVWPTLLMFAAAGFQRTDAFCFNQRYFLELTPLVAIALALTVDRLGPRWSLVLGGAGIGLLAAGAVLTLPASSQTFRHRALMKLPLLLAAGFTISSLFSRFRPIKMLTPVLLGACLSWSLAVHVGDDIATANSWRSWNQNILQIYRDKLPDRFALVAWLFRGENATPLRLERDVVILDCYSDQGQAISRHIEEFFAHQRPVFILTEGFPQKVLQKILQNRRYRTVHNYRGFQVLQVLPPPSSISTERKGPGEQKH